MTKKPTSKKTIEKETKEKERLITAQKDWESQADEYLDGWQRARAELANYRKQVAKRDKQTLFEVKQSLLFPLLELADKFKIMTAHVPKELEKDSWATGVLHVARQLDQLLAELGVELVEETNEQFDPHKHEAIEKVEDKNIASGTIVEVLQPGYMLEGEVIRPAKVKVAT